MARRAQRPLLATSALVAAASLVLCVACRRQSETGEPRASAGDARPAAAAGGELFPLPPGEPQERALAPGASHHYRLQLAAGDFLHAVAEQHGVDLELRLVAPDGTSAAGLDRPFGAYVEEPLIALAEIAGEHRLEVRAFDSKRPPGRYRLSVRALRRATEEDRLLVAAVKDFLRRPAPATRDEHRAAIPRWHDLLRRWRRLDEPWWQAETLDRLGYSHYRLGQWRQALDAYRRAADLFAAAGDRGALAYELTEAGRARAKLGDLDGAAADFERSLALRLELGDRRGTAFAHHNLADVLHLRGENRRARESYDRALAIWEAEADPREMGTTLHNLGVLYAELGDYAAARDRLRRAEAAFIEAQSSRRLASTLNQLGKLHRRLGEPQVALDLLRRALELRREADDVAGQASSLSELGRTYQDLGRREEALASYRRALAFLDRLDRPRSRAKVLRYLGSLHHRRGDFAAAAGAYRRALDLARRLHEPASEAESLAGLAQAARRQGDFASARQALEQALEIAESLRLSVLAPSLRARYFATAQPYVDAYVDLLMELHRRQPSAGHDARALEVADGARMRSLRDLLATSNGGALPAASSPLVRREAELKGEINRLEGERQRLLRLLEDGAEASRRAPIDARLTALDRSLRDLLLRLQDVRGEIRLERPAHAALTQPRRLSLKQIQQRVLGGNALLLTYRLGAERSYLWVVGGDSLASFELPPRAPIERAAVEVHRLLETSHRRTSQAAARQALCALAGHVLAPLAGHLAGEHLLIVADGALDYVPFAALPRPRDLGSCATAVPLVEDHPITYLPSASTLAALRRGRGERPAPRGLLAVVADPVLNRRDPRLRSPAGAVRAGPEDATRAAAGACDALERLPFAGREAAAILALAPPAEGFQALGFDATKELVQGGVLRAYRFVHLATHGRLDAAHPELSGLVLACLDPTGQRRDGELRLHEIYDLELTAEMVVLSACQTALGEEIRGEGLWGLTRGFLHAGAARVMVSLWRVGDRGTAELMEHVYRALLDRGLSPAAALREAQLAMRRDPQWAAPYHWAGFLIQGEWR
ncbi:MAG: CHAT domain-containing protein [Acidobacteria bacterium]|nr:MAG: CHAT domain-containing protein [Acidobacteriota bacterium]